MCVLCPLPWSLLRTPWETEPDLESKTFRGQWPVTACSEVSLFLIIPALFFFQFHTYAVCYEHICPVRLFFFFWLFNSHTSKRMEGQCNCHHFMQGETSLRSWTLCWCEVPGSTEVPAGPRSSSSSSQLFGSRFMWGLWKTVWWPSLPGKWLGLMWSWG